MSERVSHLGMIQAVITRMASNSFLIKGWSLTLTAAIFALAADQGRASMAAVAFLPVVMFWLLDAYFLRQERLFRKHYDAVRTAEGSASDFSMNTSPYLGKVSGLPRVALSQTLLLFHGSIVLTAVVVTVMLSETRPAERQEKQGWPGECSSASTTSETSGGSIRSATSPASSDAHPPVSKTLPCGSEPSSRATPLLGGS